MINIYIYINKYTYKYKYKYKYTPVGPHEQVAEASRRGKLQERLVVVRHGCQSETTDQPTNWLTG